MIDLKNKLYTNIAIVLAEKHPLTAKEIHQILKQRGSTYSYKYIHKSLMNLEKYDFVTKQHTKYNLNLNYLTNLKDFLIKASRSYDLDQNVFLQSVTGSLLKVFTKTEADEIAQDVSKQINKKVMAKLDEWYSEYYDPDGLEVKSILKQANFKNKKVLEIGCGTGRLTFPLSKKCKEIVALDQNKYAVSYCEDKFKKQKNIKIIHRGIQQLKNIKDFDIIVSGWAGIHYSKNMNQIIENLYDLLKSGGSLIIIEAYLDSEYIDILNLLRPKATKLVERQSALRSALFKKFNNVDEKIIAPKYVFPSYEKLEETFRIELVYEEGFGWSENDSKKLKKYIDKKKSLTVGEAFLLITCKKSTNR